MLNFFGNLYFRFYKVVISLVEESIPRYNAILLLSIFSMANFLTIIRFISSIIQKTLFVDWPKFALFLAGLAIIGINSYIVFGNKRYLQFEEKYEDEERPSRIKNNVIATIYVILSIVLFILTIINASNNPINKS